jgi:recombination protein RecA
VGKELDKAVELIQKQFGKTAIMKLGSSTKLDVKVISTGSLAIDAALGVGGLPRGRIVEAFGGESSGKTTLALHIIAEAQKNKGKCGFIDVEHALNPEYARKLGVDTDELFISQPDSGEEALEIAEYLIKSGEMDVVVVDSVAALVPRSELEGNMGDPQMGVVARMMSQAMSKLTAVTSKSGCCLLFINQVREKIGVVFGNPETTPGGRALKFYASIRLDIRKSTVIKTGDAKTGNLTKVRVIKNKVAAPFKEAEVEIVFGEGISAANDLLVLGVEHGIIEKAGSWFTIGSERFQGAEAAKEFLKQNHEMSQHIDGILRKKLFDTDKDL